MKVCLGPSWIRGGELGQISGVTGGGVTRHAPLPQPHLADVTSLIGCTPPHAPSSPTTRGFPDPQCLARIQTTHSALDIPNATVGSCTGNRDLRSPALHPHPRPRPQGHRGLGVRHGPTTPRGGQVGDHPESRRGMLPTIPTPDPPFAASRSASVPLLHVRADGSAYLSLQHLRTISQREENPEAALRIAIESGGCHGYQYKMELSKHSQPDD